MKKMIVRHATIFILFCVAASASAQQMIPEQALRHMARGDAAAEMAKTSEDYETAIKEFQEAARLAPFWADPNHKLGLVQEKAGKFREAASSLNRYLQLAPNAPDTNKIKELIYKLEFKAEQVITDDEALDIFASLKDNSKWQIKPMGNTKAATLSVSFDNIGSWRRKISYKGDQGISFEFWCGNEKMCCPTLNGMCPGWASPIGNKTIEFDTWFFRSENPELNSFYDFRLEVVSRNKVTMTIREKGLYESFGTYEHVYEFVRR